MKRFLPQKIIKSFINICPDFLLSAIRERCYLRMVRTFHEKDFDVLSYFIKSGDAVVDIGANAGCYTRAFSELVGENGTVYSIEPVPETFHLLSKVTAKLGLTNVRIINYAISDKNGSAIMEIPLYEENGPLFEYRHENFFRASIVNKKVDDKKGSDKLRSVQVKLKTVDSLFSGVSGKITFIKCDVEGHELAVLRGSEGLLSKARPVWLIEVSGNPDEEGSFAKGVFSYMKKYDYMPYWFDGKNLRGYVHGHKSVNYFFIHTESLNKVSKILLLNK